VGPVDPRVGSGRVQEARDISGSSRVGSRFPWVGSQNLDPRATLIQYIARMYTAKTGTIRSAHTCICTG